MKYNPELHQLVYQDKCMIEFWEHENGMVTIHQNELDDSDTNIVCIEVSEMKKILRSLGEM